MKKRNYPFCKDCDVELKDYRSVRCHSCAGKEFSKNWTRNYPICPDCGKQTKNYEATRCRSCANRHSALTGKTGFQKGHTIWLGKNHSEESKKRMSIAFKKKPIQKRPWRAGEIHHWWKGGITRINDKIRKGFDFKLWRESVFKRDNYTCRKYGIRGGELHPHHILNFSQYKDLRFNTDNGITLSEKAHREFHNKYGQTSNTKKQLFHFLFGEKLDKSFLDNRSIMSALLG